MESTQQDLRIVLLGKTGSGKSSTGNTILGRERSESFTAGVSPQSITETCQNLKTEIDGRSISVVDTPGLCDTTKTVQEINTEIMKCVEMSVPGPHVFLLVIKVGRFTEEEKNAVEWIQQNFGEEAARYTIILFTHKDQLKGRQLDEYIRESNDFKALVNECGGRFHSFNNENTENRSQVTELMEKIKRMGDENGGEYYTNEMYKKAQNKIEWEDLKQKVKDGTKTVLIVLGGGTVATAGVVAAGGTTAVVAVAGAIARAAVALGAAAIGTAKVFMKM